MICINNYSSYPSFCLNIIKHSYFDDQNKDYDYIKKYISFWIHTDYTIRTMVDNLSFWHDKKLNYHFFSRYLLIYFKYIF